MKTLANITLTILAIGLSSGAQAQINFTGTPYTQTFNSMGATGTVTPPGWFVGSGTGAAVTGTTVIPSTGTNTAGGNYNFGVAGVNPIGERALGSKGDNGLQNDTEVDFINSTGFNITNFTIQYTGEQWRDGGSGNSNSLILQLSTNGLTWTPLGTAFNFVSPINNAGSPTALDGNAAANRVVNIGGTTILSTPILNGASFYLRFADPDDPGKDSGIAIDSFRFKAIPEPSAYMLFGLGLLLCGQRFLHPRRV